MGRLSLTMAAGGNGTEVACRYISIPSLSKTPKVPHPFSYANLPNSELHRRDAVFLIKAYNGMSVFGFG